MASRPTQATLPKNRRSDKSGQPLLRRIHWLARRLDRFRQVIPKDAAEQLGVNEKTIRRDLRWMAEQMNVRVAFSRADGAWLLEGELTSFDPFIISTEDRRALLLSLRAVEQYRGLPIYRSLKDIHNRLLALLPPATKASFEAVAAKIRFEGLPLDPIDGRIWDTILLAMEERTTLRLTYRTGYSGEIRSRLVDPYGLVARHREWFLVGWDDHRGEVRTFMLSRIREASDTDESFDVRANFELDDYLFTALDSHQSGGDPQHIKLRFAAEVKVLGQEFRSNKTQKTSTDSKGRVIVEFKTAALYEVERQVLAWGGQVELLQPPSLRKVILEKANALATAHGKG